jgi:hypothetical protein
LLNPATSFASRCFSSQLLPCESLNPPAKDFACRETPPRPWRGSGNDLAAAACQQAFFKHRRRADGLRPSLRSVNRWPVSLIMLISDIRAADDGSGGSGHYVRVTASCLCCPAQRVYLLVKTRCFSSAECSSSRLSNRSIFREVPSVRGPTAPTAITVPMPGGAKWRSFLWRKMSP